MSELPWWPPVLFLLLALVGYAVMRAWSHRLDREDDEARRHRAPAE
jgi:membrane protein implicated in regulation of membrane protease activity